MRNIYIIIITCAFCIRAGGQNIADLESFEKAMKPGTQLTYEVSADSQHYNLVVTIKKLGSEVAFDWKTDEPDNKSGSISLWVSAVANATAINNKFKPGESKADNETVLVLSKKLFNDIAANAQAPIKLNGANDTATIMSNTISEFNFDLDSTLVAVPGWELQGGPGNKYTIDVFESGKFPFIYKIDFGWSMILTKLKSH